MKFLKIEDNKGYYCVIENEWKEIDKINKDDLMTLINKATEEEFEISEFKEDDIGNKAHQIIYKSIYEKFTELLKNKSKFKDESRDLYKDAFEKYNSADEEKNID